MVTEKGTLEVGIEIGGKVHKEFELRPAKVGDSVKAEQTAKGKGDLYYMLVILAEQLLSLGEIPKEQICADLLCALWDEDITTLTAARETVSKKLLGQRRV